MAYSEKIRKHILQLANEGRSPEEVVTELKRSPSWKAMDVPDARTIRNWLKETKQKQPDAVLLNKHFTDLAEAAQTLASNIQMLTNFGDFLESQTPLSGSDAGINGNVIDGGQVGIINDKGTVDVWHGYIEVDGTMDIKPIDNLLAKCLLWHFKYRFPKILSFEDWREVNSNINRDIIDKLKLLSFSRNFKICPNCPVCNELIT